MIRKEDCYISRWIKKRTIQNKWIKIKTRSSPTDWAVVSPKSWLAKERANWKEVPGPRLVVSSPETWMFVLTAQNVGSFPKKAGCPVVLHNEIKVISYNLIIQIHSLSFYTFFLVKSPHGRRVIAGAMEIAPYNRFSSACLFMIFSKTPQSLNLTAPGMPPFPQFDNKSAKSRTSRRCSVMSN